MATSRKLVWKASHWDWKRNWPLTTIISAHFVKRISVLCHARLRSSLPSLLGLLFFFLWFRPHLTFINFTTRRGMRSVGHIERHACTSEVAVKLQNFYRLTPCLNCLNNHLLFALSFILWPILRARSRFNNSVAASLPSSSFLSFRSFLIVTSVVLFLPQRKCTTKRK